MTVPSDALNEAFLANTLTPDLLDLVEALPTPGEPWADSVAATTYAALIATTRTALEAWEEKPDDYERAAFNALSDLLEQLNAMTISARFFVEEAEAHLEYEPTSPLANPERDKAIDKIRAAIDNERLPRNLRDLLDGDLSSEGIEEAAQEVRDGAEDLNDQISELEGKVNEIESQADMISAVANAVTYALDALDAYEEAEGRDDKSYAKDTLLEQLSDLVAAYNDVEVDE